MEQTNRVSNYKKPKKIILFIKKNKGMLITLSIILTIILYFFIKDYCKHYPEFEFRYDSNEASVVHYYGGKYKKPHIVKVPSSIKKNGVEYPVAELSGASFFISTGSLFRSYSRSYSPIDKVVLPNTIKTIRKGAFGGAHIKEIVFTADVDTIEPSAFINKELTIVTYGKEVTTIKKDGFEESFGSVVRINFEGDTPPRIDDGYLWEGIRTIAVPKSSLDVYKENYSKHFPNAEFFHK